MAPIYRALALLCLLSPAIAHAAWQKVYNSEKLGERVLRAVSSPSADVAVAVGFTQSNPGGFIPDYQPHVLISTDQGASFKLAEGSFPVKPLEVPTAVFFFDAQTGLVVAGDTIHRTSNGGKSWQKTTVDGNPQVLHFWDANTGFASGFSGRIWRTVDAGLTWVGEDLGTEANLGHQFWLDRQRGWMAGKGYKRVKELPMGPEWEAFDGGVVYRTQDGGATWISSQPMPGKGFGTLFFLPDGLTGWVAAEERFAESGYAAHLYKTTDGGATFTEIPLPQMGTLDWLGTIDIPILAFRIVVMRWEDESRGYLAGSALVMDHKISDVSPEFQTKICRTVQLVTQDGGATWQHTELGTIVVKSLETPPNNDGELIHGQLNADGSGWMVGDRLAIWARPSGFWFEPESPDADTSADISGEPGAKAGGCAAAPGPRASGWWFSLLGALAMACVLRMRRKCR